jgi:hypothetical protein
MKKLYLSCLGIFLFFPFLSLSQNYYLGFKAGPNFSGIAPSSLLPYTKYKFGTSIGATFDVMVSKKVSVGIEPSYMKRGFVQVNYSYTSTPDAPLLTNNNFNLTYFTCPINVTIVFGEDRYWGLALSGIPSYALEAQTNNPAPNPYPKTENLNKPDLINQINKNDFAIRGEVKFGFVSGPRGKLYCAIGVQRSVTTLTSIHYFPGNRILQEGFCFNLGGSYALKKMKRKKLFYDD